MAKGIRVNQLAKELGVESKAILAKCREEGLEDQVPNHQSTIKMGLAETIREWHATGEFGGTGGETAVAVETAPAKKRAPSRSKKAAGQSNDGDAGTSDDSDTAVAVEEPPAGSDGSGNDDDEAQVEPGLTPGGDLVPAGEASSPGDPTATQPAGAQAAANGGLTLTSDGGEFAGGSDASVAPHAAAQGGVPSGGAASVSAADPVLPATGDGVGPVTDSDAPASQPAAASGPKVVQPFVPPPPPARPTVKLESGRPTLNKPARPVAPAFVPAPAQLQGPKVVREEAPDVVSAPRPRRMAPGSTPMVGPGGTIPARAQGGRGVRSASEEEDAEAKKKAGSRTLSTRRRGPDGRRGEADEKLRDFSEQDLKDRADRINSAAASRQSLDTHLRKSAARGTHAYAKSAAERGEPIEIEEPITVRTLSTAIGVKTNDLIKQLMRKGSFVTINQALDLEVAQELALGYNVELVAAVRLTLEDELMIEFDERAAADQNMQPRPAVVTILGHVDHGKTSLLDKIRSANVASGEAGGITQHIAAWQVQTGEKRVTFIDTPGHQAFTAMRARGANMTDVVVLVIDSAQGIQPQTTESINHAKAAGVPIVVALSKVDRPDSNPEMVLGQLAAAGLNPTEWGGDTETVRVSAVTGQGIPDLIEVLDYQSQLRDLKADPDAPSRGSVIESRVDPGLGPIATVLVQDGTLRVGDVVLAGQGYGRVRSLLNDYLKPVPEAGPSTPIIISGLSELPSAGDKFYTVDDMDRARSIAQERLNNERAEALAGMTRVSFDNLLSTMKEGDIKTINLIIKADVQGSVETLVQTVTDQNTEEVRVKVIHSGVGPISESDVELANASGAVIIGFHVVPDEAARHLAEQRRVEVRVYRVIYEIFDDLKKALSGMLEPEIREKLHGHAEVRQVFKVSRLGNIAGCFVTDGHIQRGSKVRLLRDGTIITQDLAIDTLKRLKDDVKEVKTGFECGIKLSGYDDIKIGDVFEAYIRETFQRTL